MIAAGNRAPRCPVCGLARGPEGGPPCPIDMCDALARMLMVDVADDGGICLDHGGVVVCEPSEGSCPA